MSQTTILVFGAIAGIILQVTFNRFAPTPGVFLSAVIGAWLGIATYALITGKVTIAGRGGKTPKTFSGLTGRLVGLLVFLLAIAFTAGVIEMR